MKPTELNPAERAELERLMAEQTADDTDFVRANGKRSLDAPLTDDGDASLHEIRELEPIESVPVRAKLAYTGVRPEAVREWRRLRKDGWTYQQIADYASVTAQTVRNHISDGLGRGHGHGKRLDERLRRLEQRFEEARRAYEAGAFLREIAEVWYEEIGYGTWEACYQALRKLFIRNGVTIRERDMSKRARSGRPAPDAPYKEWQRFWRKQNQRAKERRPAKRVLCGGLVNGRPCHNFAMKRSRFCGVHDDETKPPTKWTKEAVFKALRGWAEANGCNPKAKDWTRATDDHPAFKTVTDLFGRWNVALYEAGLYRGYSCPSCGGPTCKRKGRGRPPKCVSCKDAVPISRLESHDSVPSVSAVVAQSR